MELDGFATIDKGRITDFRIKQRFVFERERCHLNLLLNRQPMKLISNNIGYYMFKKRDCLDILT